MMQQLMSLAPQYGPHGSQDRRGVRAHRHHRHTDHDAESGESSSTEPSPRGEAAVLEELRWAAMKKKNKKMKASAAVASGPLSSGTAAKANVEALPPAAGWQGFSMEEARSHAQSCTRKIREKQPREVLADLQRGNARFWTGAATRPEVSAFERRALIMQQYPATAILGCSDSRVPIEIVFDQGLGDMFVVRVAGNLLDCSTAASLQYAVTNLKVKVLVVMGHEGCGAIKAALGELESIDDQAQALVQSLQRIRDGLDVDRLNLVSDFRARDREAVVTNVRRTVEQITQCECIMRSVNNKELIVVGAFYEISSGIVDFFLEVSAEDPLVLAPARGVLTRMISNPPTPIIKPDAPPPTPKKDVPAFPPFLFKPASPRLSRKPSLM